MISKWTCMYSKDENCFSLNKVSLDMPLFPPLSYSTTSIPG